MVIKYPVYLPRVLYSLNSSHAEARSGPLLRLFVLGNKGYFIDSKKYCSIWLGKKQRNWSRVQNGRVGVIHLSGCGPHPHARATLELNEKKKKLLVTWRHYWPPSDRAGPYCWGGQIYLNANVEQRQQVWLTGLISPLALAVWQEATCLCGERLGTSLIAAALSCSAQMGTGNALATLSWAHTFSKAKCALSYCVGSNIIKVFIPSDMLTEFQVKRWLALVLRHYSGVTRGARLWGLN